MATLYTLAESNTRKTQLLILLFLVIIIFFGFLFDYFFKTRFFLFLATILAISQSLLSYWYSDKIVLAMTRAREVKREDNPDLYRIVENLCIGAGLPLPKIYIIDEAQPNAFATGRDPEHAVVAVTKGLLEKLEKSELEGVIAHELAHIGNRDILLQTVVVVLVAVIGLLSEWFLRMSRFATFRKREKEKEGTVLIFLLFGILAAIFAPLVAQIIRFAISRKREFLADATGALITRYPEGLARALEKISADQNQMKVATSFNAHLFIVNPFRGEVKTSWFTKLFSTHPPIEERIKALREMSL
jgi:heat shock protein HtpX